MSTQIDLGPVLSIPKGDWNANTTYERLNLVRHNSAAWICNVDTSIGVEPSEDSTDWFLQVKDTSSVTSVNGMKGDVEISTIQTPSNDSDDTSIANTEWVRDRINETINNANSYTNNAINTATMSILDAAAQDASSKAATAVNQALATSEAKFAAKKTVSDLADNIGILIENDVMQNAAIAGKLDKSGGTMTGNLTVPNVQLAQSSEGYGELVGADSYAANPGPRIRVYKKDDPTYPGYLILQGRTASANTEMQIRPGEGAFIAGQKVLTSAGGTLTGSLRFPQGTIFSNNSSGSKGLVFKGDTGDWTNTSGAIFFASTDPNTPGNIVLHAAKNGTVSEYVFTTDGQILGPNFQVLTSADSASISGYAMPGAGYSTITSGTSGTYYTMPTNGEIVCTGTSTGTAYLSIDDANGRIISGINAEGSGTYLVVPTLMAEGQSFRVRYGGIDSLTIRVRPCAGEN